MKLALLVEVVTVVTVLGGLAVWAWGCYSRLRIKGVAQELGLKFLPMSDMLHQLEGCDLFTNLGHQRECLNCLAGQVDETEFLIFECQFCDDKIIGRNVHLQTVALLSLTDFELPSVQVASKGFFDNRLHASGGSFELDDAAFGKRYWTRSEQKGKASGLFTDEVKALIQSRGWSLEISRDRLLIFRPGNIVEPSQLREFLKLCVQMKGHLESALDKPAIPAFLLGPPGHPEGCFSPH